MINVIDNGSIPPMPPFSFSDIYLFEVELNPSSKIQNWQSILSDEEIKKAQRFHFVKHQNLYISAHVALRYVLGQFLSLAPAALCFYKEAHGKPTVLPKGKLEFNLSHSGDRAFIGVSCDNAIGVDIEALKARNLVELAARYFAKAEAQAVQLARGDREQQRQFFQIWAQKEAFIKALGEGLRYPLDVFTTPLTENPINVACQDLAGTPWYISSFIKDDFAYAFCSAKKITHVEIRQFDWGCIDD